MSPWLMFLVYGLMIILWYRWIRKIINCYSAGIIPTITDLSPLIEVFWGFLTIYSMTFIGIVGIYLACLMVHEGIAPKFVFLAAAIGYSFLRSVIESWPQLFEF